MRARGQAGQASVEWIAVVAVVALAFASLLALGVRVPGVGLAETIGEKIACAVRLGTGCGGPGDLTFAYGAELAEEVSEHAPLVAYERGMRSLPVDFRECAEVACAEGAENGRALFSDTDEPVTAFTRVADCRAGGDAGGANCSGDAAGNLYIQYWFYYPDSYTAPYPPSDFGPIPGSGHAHDWESYQVRIGPDGEAEARASAHHGYDYTGTSISGLANQVGKVPFVGVPLPKSAAWGPALGTLWVSDDSHAGRVVDGGHERSTPRHRLWLRPLELIADGEGKSYDFGEILPPWDKGVWVDPESRDT